MRRKFAVIVWAVMLLLLVQGMAFASYYNEGHYGLTEDDAYIIDSVADMVEFRDRVNSGSEPGGLYYRLARDLNLTQYTEWDSIGRYTDVAFTGHFDGGGYTLKVDIEGGGYILCAVRSDKD